MQIPIETKGQDQSVYRGAKKLPQIQTERERERERESEREMNREKERMREKE